MLLSRISQSLLAATFSLLLAACANLPEGRGGPELRSLAAALGADVPAADQA